MTSMQTGRGIGLALASCAGLIFAIVAGAVLGSRAPHADPTRTAPVAAYPSGEHVDAGAEAASRMVDRLQRFRTGNLGRRMTFRSEELTAVVRHVVPGLLPKGVTDPVIRIVGTQVYLRARVSPEALPGGEHLGGALSALPEQVDVELSGTLRLQSGGWVAYRIEHAEVEGLPLPTSVVAGVVSSWPDGRIDGTLEAPHAIFLTRWPLPATRFHVRDDVLVLQRDEPILAESVDGSDGA